MYIIVFLTLLIIIFSLSLLSIENTIYGLLLFVFIIIAGVIALFSVQIEYLSYIFLLVYLGAISVLFVFAIALLGLGSSGVLLLRQSNAETSINIWIGWKAILSVAFCALTLQDCFESSTVVNNMFCIEYKWDDLQALAILFCVNNFQLILIGLVLLLSMVGSIGLCLN